MIYCFLHKTKILIFLLHQKLICVMFRKHIELFMQIIHSPENIRSIDVPDFLSFEPFMAELHSLFNDIQSIMKSKF